MKIRSTISILLLAICQNGWGQGFANFNFESANLTGYSQGNLVPATNAFPSWTINAPYIVYDDISLSGGSLTIWDTNSPIVLAPIQGKYFVGLASVNEGTGYSISLGQTGTVPSSAQSISFWGNIGGMQVTFNGQPLTFIYISNVLNYAIWGADISAYANQTGELLFTVPPFGDGATLDNIQFSSLPIPEPSALALAALGALVLGFHCRRSRPN
jgi:hypothetical protein